MLILSRKKDESVIIDDNIEITIIGIENGRVRIGIDAPSDIEILRKELYIQVEDINKSAAFKSSKLDELKGLFKKK